MHINNCLPKRENSIFFITFVRSTKRKTMKLRYLTFWWVLAPLLTCSASNFFFKTVNVKDGLADNFVRDVVRDSHGYIWLSTINGISRYDGYRFCNYIPLDFGGRSNDVHSIRETADSTLWMTCTGDFFTYERRSGTWKKDGDERLRQLGVKGTAKVLYVDDRHNLWVTTEFGLYHYDYSQRKLVVVDNYSKSPISHIVAKNGTAAVITAENKIYEVALKERRLIPLTQAPETINDRDSRVYLDNSMNLWVYQAHSLPGTQWLFSLKTRQWRQPSELKQMGNALLNVVCEDNDGNLWVGTGTAGVFVFFLQDGEWNKMLNVNAFLPRSSHITCLYPDVNNTMWVGSSKLGVAMTDMGSPSFNVVSTGEYEDVSSLLEDHSGNLWIGFDGAGVLMKTRSGTVRHFSALQNQLPSDIVTSLAVLDDGTLLVGTYGNGIAKYDGTRFTPIYHDCSHLDYVKAMTTDTRGNLWIATVDKGVVKVTPDGKKVKLMTENSPLLSNGILCLTCDSLREIVYIGTSLGLSAYDCAKGQFIQNKQIDQLKDVYVSSLMMCEHNRLWVGSRNGLWILHPKEEAVTHLTTEQGLSHNVVRALARSGSYVWASTDNGLTCIYPQVSDSQSYTCKCYPYLDADGLHNVIFSNNAGLTTTDGMALLGSFSGYVRIMPENATVYYPKLQVLYTDYWVNAEPNSFSDFTIRHDDRFWVAVSAMVPALSHKIKYLYRFKGDEEWIAAPSSMLYFVSLKPGKHILQVKAVIPGLMESEIAELPIKVKPPILQSRPAFLIYLLLLAALLYYLIRAMRRRQKRELAMKQMEVNLKKYEMEEDKIRFFTNVGHDLKTPLTLVMAPLEKIRKLSLPAPIRTEVDVAWRNARQLYDLVLQVLDFRRLDVGREKLNLKHGDIVSFVRQTVQSFDYYAMGKQIQMDMHLPPSSIEIDFDEDKLRRIITNLLSNAFKYNVDNGSVAVLLDVTEEEQQRTMVISVADTGIGIKDKKHVFDRFVQESHGQEQEGSGLGLHIVRQYVSMMGGSIDVADNKPKGTIFTVTLPVMEAVAVEGQQAAEDNAAAEEVVPDISSERPTLLVVEDNTDARLFLQRSLDDEYQVLVAANGKEALQVLSKNDNVSIVVSDVMMPVMDGMALFRQLKSNIKYSHIPVVLLTAKSGEENIVEGLKKGAADYITKPFSLEVLRLRLRKILEWSQQTHTKVAAGMEIKPSEITVSSLDEELISHVIANIEENIGDINYSVVQLSSAVGMTRGHLYKKLMAITGKSPLEFMRVIKLKRGKSLLDQGRTNISEVADMVGLSSKQFTHYFKQMHDDTPSEYLRKIKKQ